MLRQAKLIQRIFSEGLSVFVLKNKKEAPMESKQQQYFWDEGRSSEQKFRQSAVGGHPHKTGFARGSMLSELAKACENWIDEDKNRLGNRQAISEERICKILQALNSEERHSLTGLFQQCGLTEISNAVNAVKPPRR
jgi:hypothetical protein